MACLCSLVFWPSACLGCHLSRHPCSFISRSGNRGGREVAAAAEDRKANKYIHLDSTYLFIPLAFETLGIFGPKTLAFVRELGRRISQETGEERGNKLPRAALVHGCADGKFSCGVGVLQAPLTALLLLLLLLLLLYYYILLLLSLLHSIIINK